MKNYNIGDILNINNIDFCILNIIPYKSQKYIIATEYIEKIISEKPKIIMLKEISPKTKTYGTYFDLVNSQKEIEAILKTINI